MKVAEKLKKFSTILSFLFILAVFVSCGDEKIPGENEYIGFPDNFNGHFSDYDYSVTIYIDVKWSDKTRKKAQYQAIMKSGSSFINGNVHYTEKGLVFDYPEEIDFSSCEGTDEEKQAFIDFYFPKETQSFWVYKPELRINYYKGFYAYKDILMTSDTITTRLNPGDHSFIDDIPVLLANEVFTVKDTALIYEKPEFKSKQIPVTKINWDYFNNDNFTKIVQLKNDYALPAWTGLRFSSDAKTIKTLKKNGIENNWYRVSIRDYCNESYGWIFGEDLVSVNDDTIGDYQQEIINRGIDAELIKTIKINEDELPRNLKYFCIGEEGESELYYNDEIIYLFTPYSRSFAKLERDKLYIDSDGFLKLDLGSKKILLIDGEYISQCFRNFQLNGDINYDEENNYSFHDYYFKSIAATSYLTETINDKDIKYTPENLYKGFYIGCRCHPYWWNYNHIPWVEGVDGNGTGESITIEFTQNMNGISILNGYTDINNMKLFKENSRVKKLIIEDLVNNNTQTMDFEDYVYFNYIKFKQPTIKIKLTISEIYSGSKYMDTCISAIIPSNNERTNEEITEGISKQFLNYYRLSDEKTLSDIIEVF